VPATRYGTQEGDPAKAGRAIIAAVVSDDPPLMLVRGPDALTNFRSSMKALSADLDTWQQTSIETSFTSEDTSRAAQ
jgi:hypothetical protein